MKVGESKNVGFRAFVDVIINIDGVWKVVIDKCEALSINNSVFRVCPFLSKCDILKRSQRFSYLLQIITFFVLFASVFSLISIGVVLTSFLDFFLRPPFVIVYQKDFLDVTDFDF